MDVVYLLVPLSILFLICAIWALLWAIRSEQFDDLESPATRLTMNDRHIRSKKDE